VVLGKAVLAVFWNVKPTIELMHLEVRERPLPLSCELVIRCGLSLGVKGLML
jgi:hypothetical protein